MDEKDFAQKVSRSAMRKKMRTLTVLTVLSVFTAVVAILACVFLIIHFHIRGAAIAAFETQSEQFEKEEPIIVEEESTQEETVETLSHGIYTQEDVDNIVSQAMQEASTHADTVILDVLQNRLVEGDGTMSIFRDLYPEHVVMLDSGQYYFIEKNDSLAPNTYNTQWFKKDEKGFVEYIAEPVEDSENTEEDAFFQGPFYKGIDVSKFQGEIDWKKVKESGIDYAIIRVGIRGYTEGLIVEDEFFQQNIEGALAENIPVGVYFFTAAVNEQEIREEAQFVIDKLKEYDVTYPVYLDIEDVKSKNCRTNHLTSEQRTDLAEIFLQMVEEAGYIPGLYGNLKSYMLMLDLTRLESYDKWLATYTLPVYYPYEYKMLQYSESGRLAGIEGDVDLNISFKNYAEE